MGVRVVKTVSVLLAAYNGAGWLREQLRTLREQDDPGFRVLMQDDGSTDGTASVLESVCREDPRFACGREAGRHLGPIGNFWSLLGQDGADYSALCDQDDLWHSDRLSRCRAVMARAEAQYGADTPLLVHSDCRLIDAEDRVLHESFFQHQGWRPSATGLNALLVQNNVTGCTVMLNRALRERALACGDPEKMVMHDWFLAQTAAACGRVIFIDAPLVDYRQHGDNVKGASADSLTKRGVKALSAREKGRARIRLTYDNARMLRECLGDTLPEAARKTLDDYLALEKLPKPRRLIGYVRGGYLMQSPVTVAGQLFFG